MQTEMWTYSLKTTDHLEDINLGVEYNIKTKLT
jgi:hypothetical protein